MIPFNDFKREYALIQHEIDEAIHRVLHSGWYILGKECELFEKEFASYIGAKYCVGVANGTEAIALALLSMGIEPDDEVITTNMTAFPTITGIVQAGAKPVVAEIRTDDGLMDCTKIEAKITVATKAIVPVHLYGQCCDMDLLQNIANQHNLQIMEDCAQAAGSEYKGKKAGTFGAVAAFSFYPTKNLGAYGDAGAVVTNNSEIYQKLLSLRNYGQTKRYYHDTQGINSRLDELQAAILRVKLRHLDSQNRRRREIAALYRQNLQHVTCLTEHSYGQANYHLFVVKTSERDRYLTHLNNNGINALIHYPIPINKQKSFPYQKDEIMKNTDEFAQTIFSLPIYPELTDNEVYQIIETVNSYSQS